MPDSNEKVSPPSRRRRAQQNLILVSIASVLLLGLQISKAAFQSWLSNGANKNPAVALDAPSVGGSNLQSRQSDAEVARNPPADRLTVDTGGSGLRAKTSSATLDRSSLTPTSDGLGTYFTNRTLNPKSIGTSLTPASAQTSAAAPKMDSLMPIVSAPSSNDAFTTNPVAMAGVANFSNNFIIGSTTPAAGGAGTPASGDALYFGASSTTTLNDDLAAGTVFAGLFFNSGASAFTIGGNPFTLSAGITNNSAANQTVNDNVTLGANQTWLAGTANGTTLTLGGSVTGAGITLTTNGGTGSPLSVPTNTVFTGTVSLGSLAAQGNPNNGPNFGSNPTTTFMGASTLTTTGNVVVGRSNLTFTGNSVANIAGSITNAQSTAGNVDWATVNISGAANVTTASLNLNGNGVTGLFSLNGGTLTTGSIASVDSTDGTYTNRNVLNGTQIIASQSNSAFLTIAKSSVFSGAGEVFVGNGGALFNSNGFDIGTATAFHNNPGSTGILTKSGVGTMALSGVSDYTGTTTISGGTLQLGNGGTTGALSPGSAIVDNATFAVNRSNTVLQGTDFSSAAITGTGGFTQAGTGSTTLSAANTFTGLTTVNAGVLNITGSVASAVTVNSGGTLSGYGNGTSTGQIANSVTVAGGGAVALAQGSAVTPLTVGGALTLGGTGSYGAGQFAALNFTLGTGIQALNASGTLTLNLGGAYINLIGATSTGTYNLLTFSSQSGAGSFSLSNTTAGVMTANIGRNTYTLLDNATSLQLQVAGAAIPGVAYFDGAVSSQFNDLSSTTLVNFSSNMAGTTDAGNIPGAVTDVILNASNASAASTATETLGASTTINSLRVIGNGTTTIAADGSTLTINALTDSNTASDGSFTGNTAGTGISIAGGANAFTINVPVVLGNSQSWTNNSANLFTVGGTSVNGTAATGSTQTLTLANTGAGGTTVSAVIGDGSLGGKLALAVNNTSTGATVLSANNTYTGGTTIIAGTLQVGNGGSTGTLGSGSLVDNGILSFNTTAAPTISTVISGSGAVALNGTSNLTLSGNNTFSGGIAVNGGTTLNTGGAAANAVFGTGPVTVAPTGTLNLNGNGADYKSNFIFNGGTMNNNNGNNVLGSTANTIAVNGATTINTAFGYGINAAFTNGNQGKALELNGILSGTGAITVNGVNGGFGEASGIFINNNANTYSGTLTINANSGNGLAVSLGGNTALQYATVVVNGVSANAQTRYGLGFSGFSNTGTNGDFSTVTAPVIGGLSGNGNIALQTYQQNAQNSEGTGAPVVLTVGGNNADVAYTGILSGTGGLTKAGTGMMTLNTADSYTGPTTVTGGTLTVPGSLSSSTVNVNAGMLNLTGTLVGSAVTVSAGGTFNEGTTGVISGAGSLTTSSNITLAISNTYTGATTISGGTLTLTKAGSAPDPNNTFQTAGGTLPLTSGLTVNTGGMLVLGASNTIGSGPATSGTGNGGTGMTLAGGMLSVANGVTQGQGSNVVGGANDRTVMDVPGLGNLTLTASSALKFAGSSGTLVFNGLTLNGNALSIGGTHFATLLGNSADGATDRLIVEDDGTLPALSAGNLALITFANYGNSAATDIDLGDGFYEIIPISSVLVPEPSTWVALLLGLGAFGVYRRSPLLRGLLSRLG